MATVKPHASDQSYIPYVTQVRLHRREDYSRVPVI